MKQTERRFHEPNGSKNFHFNSNSDSSTNSLEGVSDRRGSIFTIRQELKGKSTLCGINHRFRSIRDVDFSVPLSAIGQLRVRMITSSKKISFIPLFTQWLLYVSVRRWLNVYNTPGSVTKDHPWGNNHRFKFLSDVKIREPLLVHG